MKSKRAVTFSKPRSEYAPERRPEQRGRTFDTLMQLMAHETGKAIPFEFVAKPGSWVSVAGTFNNWDPSTHPLTYHPADDVFRATLLLPKGAHEYKYVVNGAWHMDAKCPHWKPNGHGTLNSVIQV